MKFSIIIPVYNEECFLGTCIESIIKQSYSDFEILIIDDGSEDRTRDVALTYVECDSRIKLYCHEKNQGLGAARNTGIRHARGEYLLFVDGDDFIGDYSLTEVECSVRGCPEVCFLTSCKIKNKVMESAFKSFDSKIFEDEIQRVLPKLIRNKIFIGSACEKAIRRDFILENSIFFPENRKKETIVWCVRLLISMNTIAYCNVDYYYYSQQGKDSLSGQINHQSVEDVVLSLKESLSLIEEPTMEEWRREVCFTFLSSSALFAAEYMIDFGNENLEKKLSKYLFLLNYSDEFDCFLAREQIKLFGIHKGLERIRDMAKLRYENIEKKNVFLKGDNLKGLRFLEEMCFPKADFIYIDPPYNTNILVDANTRTTIFVKDEEWSDALYSRLQIARQRMNLDALICISINDRFQAETRIICNKIFGKHNFVAQVVRKRTNMVPEKSVIVQRVHEYVLIFARDIEKYLQIHDREPVSTWWEDTGESVEGYSELETLVGESSFKMAKPVALIKNCIRFCPKKDAVVLDFYAGSGTTAQAVLEMNREDGGNRTFQLVQRSELIEEGIDILDIAEKRIVAVDPDCEYSSWII